MISRRKTVTTLVVSAIVLQLLIKSSQAATANCDATVEFCNLKTGTVDCPSGYVEENNKCVKSAESACMENEELDEDKKCVCKANYERDEYDVCNASCEPKCGEGEFCFAPNKCECQPGRERSAEGKCEPMCDPKCDGFKEYCEKPNQCACETGYTNTSGLCQPQCLDKCQENAECIEPNKCACKKGYEQSIDGKCEPYCAGGCPENSECTSPDKCVCKEGFAMKHGQCKRFEEACIDTVHFLLEFNVECDSVSSLKMLLWSLGGLLGAVYFLVMLYCIVCCCQRRRDRHEEFMASYDTSLGKVAMHRGCDYDEL